MAKLDLGDKKSAFIPPTTTTILGSQVDGRANFMALAWLTRCNYKPPLVAIAVNNRHRSGEAILATGQFSINVPGPELIQKTDYVGLVSGRQVDKSGLFTVFYGGLPAAPLIAECPLNVELEVYETVELPTNRLFIGQVVGLHAEEAILTEGAPDPAKLKPTILTMPDNRYWSLGENPGRAWREGKALKA